MKAKRKIIYSFDNRRDSKEFTREEAAKRLLVAYRRFVCGEPTDFVCGIATYALSVCKPKDPTKTGVYWKECNYTCVTYKHSRFYGTLTPEIITVLIEAFNLDWVNTSWIRKLIRRDNRLWSMIISKKVTNPEQLCKKYSKMYFGGKYSYRALRKYYELRISLSLWDIYDYTSNPEVFIERYCDNTRDEDNYEISALYRDTLQHCKINNTQLNPLWSIKRLEAEHQLQVEESNRKQIESCPCIPITSPMKYAEIELIVDERTCFLESLRMHNCIHSCYWSKVLKGNYILCRGDSNGEHFNLGIHAKEDNVWIDQIHTKYNGPVSPNVRDNCVSWVTMFKEELIARAKDIRDSYKEKMKEENSSPLDMFEQELPL